MMDVKAVKKHTGFSLVELMIAMVLGLIVVGGAMSMYITTIRSSADIVNSARLNHDLDSLMQLMVNDIRRSGYWGAANVNSMAKNNPFTVGALDIQLSNKSGEANNTCILYAYDGENGNGIADLKEYYGFRLNGTGIDMHFAKAVGVENTCDSGHWESIVDTNNVAITRLTFGNAFYKCLNLTQGVAYTDMTCATVLMAGNILAGELAVETRQIDIILAGQVVGDDAVTKKLTGIVKVRNERIFIQS